MGIHRTLLILILGLSPAIALSQQIAAPESQSGSIIGTVIDIASNPVPEATVVLNGPTASEGSTATTNELGFFAFRDLQPGVLYHITIKEKGFADWASPEVVLKPGQLMDMGAVHLKLSVVETTVTAVTQEQIALEQVTVEEQQRVLGIVPNFYVVYDPKPAPLPVKLKFRLALRAETDIVTIAGDAALAGFYQAVDYPDFQQGAKGYAQRFGVAYADSFTDIMIGSAILPSLLHQDPRYFYQGTGTTRSRALHALSYPFICKGDNGKLQFNYSSIGGDLASGAISNLYYPESNRGPALVFEGALIDTGARMAEGLLQEFVLRNFTSHAKN